MSLRFLLDTNVVSEPVRPDPDAAILERLREHRHEIAIAAPTWHELLFGLRRLPPSRKRQALERYLREAVEAGIPILPYTREAADWHATQRARLVTAGRTPPWIDSQIAAVAVVNRLVLVTANWDDFVQFEGLELADWRSTGQA